MGKRPNLSKICFGCEPLGGTDWGEINIADIAAAIELALDLGVNFFDTAEVYGLGLSETRLSEILGPRRHDVFIATKGGMTWQLSASGVRPTIGRDSSPKHLREAVEGSLRRLRLEYLPIYYIHWPDPNTDIRTTFECLAQLQNVGKIGWIGCSNFSADQVCQASEVADVSLVQMPINILGQDMDPKMREVVIEKGIGVVAYNVLANGLLTGKYGANVCFPASDRRARLPLFQGDAFREVLGRVREFSSVAQSLGLTCAQFAISKVLERAEVASTIVGIKNYRQIEENAAILAAQENRN